jgi:exosortase
LSTDRLTNGILEDFRIEFLDCWQRLPNKGLFFGLLAAWLALFQFLGNSTLGYIHTPSLLSWMYLAYQPSGEHAMSDDRHGMLIPFVVLGLLWWKRKQLFAQPLRSWAPALVLVALGLLFHIAGYLFQQPRISIVGLFVGIYGLTGLAWGLGWLRASFFPFFLFAFSVPLGSLAQSITFPLQLLVCKLVEFVSHFILAIDILRDGTQLMDPTGRYRYEVAAACSGMRSLIATLAFAFVYSFLGLHTWWKRGLVIASAIPLAVLGNLIRMLTIVIAAEIGGQQAGNYVHEGGPQGILSLLPYIPAFAGLLIMGHYLREEGVEPDPGMLPQRT